MEFRDFINLVFKKKQTIFSIVFFVVVLVIVISLLSPIKYGVNSRLLIIQDSVYSDTYALSRSNEYVSNLLAEVIYSTSFYDQVLSSRYDVSRAYFSNDYKKALKKWRQTVNARVLKDTGIIEINIYHTNTNEAKKIALAVNNILINNNSDYQSNQNMLVKILDQPLSSNYPVKPNIILNLSLAIFFSFFVALIYVYIFPEDRYNFYLTKSRQKKKYKKTNFREKKQQDDLNIKTLRKSSNDIVNRLTELEKNNNELEGEIYYDNYEGPEIKGNIDNIINNNF